MSRCSSDKCFSRLAQVVKLARDCGVTLDRKFYRSVLLSLQQWGQDQEAVAEVLCNLGEGVASVGEESWVGLTGGPRGTSEMNTSNRKRLVVFVFLCHVTIHPAGKCRDQSLHLLQPRPPIP